MALRGKPLLARAQGGLGRHLIADVGKDGEDRELAVARDEPRRKQRPEGRAVGPADAHAQAVGAPFAAQPLRQLGPLGRIDVVRGDALAHRIVLRHAEDLRRPLVDGDDGVVAQAADDGRERTDVEELGKERDVGDGEVAGAGGERRQRFRRRAARRHRWSLLGHGTLGAPTVAPAVDVVKSKDVAAVRILGTSRLRTDWSHGNDSPAGRVTPTRLADR